MPEPTYIYDPIRGQYVNATTGEPLSDAEIRAADEALIAALTLILVGLTRDLQAGKLDLAAWQLAMGQNIKAAHTAVGAVGYGGLAELSPARLAVLEAATRTQLEYLDNWARELAGGQAPLDDRMLVRAGLYANAPRGTLDGIERQQARIHGANEEKNILDAKESCTGCRAATRAGWVRINSLPPVGQRQCLANCKCRIVYRVNLDIAS